MDIVSQLEEAIQISIFLFKVSNSDSKMVSLMFQVKNKDVRTTLTLSVSFVDFEQVNVC